MLNVEAIFNSIDGEYNGFRGAGELTTFIRLKGCNLKCSFCDTAYSQGAGEGKLGYLSILDIYEYRMLKKVTITGGEPLFQEKCADLIESLLQTGHQITVETNGSILIPKFHPSLRARAGGFLSYVVDYKLPSSGVHKEMKEEIFTKLRGVDVIKFVIADLHDFNVALNFIASHSLLAKLVFSPAIEDQNDYTGWPSELAILMIDRAEELRDISYSLQIHKVLFPNFKIEI